MSEDDRDLFLNTDEEEDFTEDDDTVVVSLTPKGQQIIASPTPNAVMVASAIARGLKQLEDAVAEPLPHGKLEWPVIGYRGFYARYDETTRKVHLFSANVALGSWATQGPTEAKCMAHYFVYEAQQGDHEVCDPGCTCGLYVLADLNDAPNWFRPAGVGKPSNYQKTVTGLGGKFLLTDIPDDAVIAAVLGWGRIVQHGWQGWRAQYAMPIAFMDTALTGSAEILEMVSEQYKVPVLSRESLQNYVNWYLAERLPGQEPK